MRYTIKDNSFNKIYKEKIGEEIPFKYDNIETKCIIKSVIDEYVTIEIKDKKVSKIINKILNNPSIASVGYESKDMSKKIKVIA